VTDDFFALDVSSLNVRTYGGYLHFYHPGHPLARQNGYVALQRHVVSVRLGRWLL
jgi:flagellar basal body rod protein FlgC